MTDQGLQMVAFAVFVVALGAVLLPWRRLALRWVGNSTDRARLYVDTGIEIVPVKAYKIATHNDGETYRYKWAGMQKEVIVPNEYPDKYLGGWRMVGLFEGEPVASPWVLNPRAPTVSEETLSVITQGRVAVDLAKAITGVPMKISGRWLLIAGIVLLAFFLYTQFGESLGLPAVGGGEATEVLE